MMRRPNFRICVSLFAALLAGPACSSDGGDDGGGDSVAADGGVGPDGSSSAADAGGGGGTGADAGSQSSGLDSTLVSDCAVFEGRAVVNFNGNLGISFTDSDSPFTFRSTLQFELDSNYSGMIPNPENWDGAQSRQIVAVTTPEFALHGNHCWFDNDASPAGSVTILDYRPSEGIVKAEFNALRLRSCVGATVCTVSGTIETTGQGVFE